MPEPNSEGLASYGKLLNKCTGWCSCIIAICLFLLGAISIICNIMLFFPGGEVKYAQDGLITEQVKYMGGAIGGGLMVLVPALFIYCSGNRNLGCCMKCCRMFLSIGFAAMGAVGALYSLVVAGVGLSNGPLCKVSGQWTTPFKQSYLINSSLWEKCTEPKNVVQFNIRLFITLLVTSGLQLILCGSQMINGFIGCICACYICACCKGKGKGNGNGNGNDNENPSESETAH